MTSVCFSDGIQRATVELAVGTSESVIKFATSPDLPACSDIYDVEEQGKVSDFTAAIAAVQSGVIFASKKAGMTNIKVTVLRLVGYVDEEGYTGFAVAASQEFLKQAGVTLTLSDPNSAGWSVVE